MSKILIKKLTPEQKAAMPAYAQKWIEIGLRTGKTDFETFDKYMPICYEKAGLKYPKNVVRVKSPLVGALAASIAEAIWKKKREAVGSAVDGAVGEAVEGAVGEAVDGVVREAVHEAVHEAVDVVVLGAVREAVNGDVGRAVFEAVRRVVDGAVNGAVGSAVDGAVGEAVDGVVREAVHEAVHEAVDVVVLGAVGSAVGGAVREAVHGDVGRAVFEAVRRVVDGAVNGAVHEAVRRDVGRVVNDAVDRAVFEAVHEAVQTTTKKKKSLEISWHYWLGGQFWVGYGWYWGTAFSNFFFDVCGLKLSQDIMERAEAYRKVCESVNYIWPNSDFIIVCERPTEIHRNSLGRLHNENGMAIKYPDGWGLYLLNGVRFPEELYKKVISRKMSWKEISEIVDIDQRTQAMKFADINDFEKLGTIVDTYEKSDIEGNTVIYKLLYIPEGMFTTDAYFAIYDCPSTRNKYISGIDPEIGKKKSIAESMAWKLSMSKEQWKLMTPLAEES